MQEDELRCGNIFVNRTRDNPYIGCIRQIFTNNVVNTLKCIKLWGKWMEKINDFKIYLESIKVRI